MAVLGVANGLRQLAGQLDDAYGLASVQVTMWWLANEDRIEPVVQEVASVLPWVSLALGGIEYGLPGPEIVDGTEEVIDALEQLADLVELTTDQLEVPVLEPEPTSTLIGGPELETLVQASQVLADGEEAQRRDLAAALDQGEAAFWGRNDALEGEARKQAEAMLEEARKEALRALEARQKEDRERDGPTF